MGYPEPDNGRAAARIGPDAALVLAHALMDVAAYPCAREPLQRRIEIVHLPAEHRVRPRRVILHGGQAQRRAAAQIEGRGIGIFADQPEPQHVPIKGLQRRQFPAQHERDRPGAVQ